MVKKKNKEKLKATPQISFIDFSPYGYHKTNKKVLIRLTFITISIICIQVSTMFYMNGAKILKIESPMVSTLQASSVSLNALSKMLNVTYLKTNDEVNKTYTPELNSEITAIISKLPSVTMTTQLNVIDNIMQKFPGLSLENMDITSSEIVYIVDYDTIDNLNQFLANLEQSYSYVVPLNIKAGQAKIQLRGYDGQN